MDFDIAILGGGPGGYVAAIRAAQRGARVALIEKTGLGGTCLHRGCIPSKALLTSAQIYTLVRRAEDFGVWTSPPRVDLPRMIARKDEVVAKNAAGVASLLDRRKVTVIRGAGRLTGSRSVEIDLADGGRDTVGAKHLIVATGSEPLIPPAFGFDGERVLTSTEALNLRQIPDRLLIAGGSAVGCEFAALFSALGSQVVLVEMLDRLLTAEDEEISRRLAFYLKRGGVEIRLKTRIEEMRREGGGVVIRLEGGEILTADYGLLAVGRALNLSGIGLEEAGIACDRRGIAVDERMETSAPGVYAAGDVTGKLLLAHVASAQGIVAAENAAGGDRWIEYDTVPRCIFTFPEVGSVGLSEAEARGRGYAVKVGRFPFTASGKALAIGETDGFAKVVLDGVRGTILGVHLLGPHATDLIAEGVLAMQMGTTAGELVDTIHAHPTLSEAVKESVEAALGLAIHSG